ncbi:MAG TPA: TonB-dependent receptor [Candidatus Udaeobacter sp.]|nr:TonB-dependent receptor [Candidatus Udaeobacter sp.]
MRRNLIRQLVAPHFISASVGGLFALLTCSVSAQNPLPTPEIPTEAEVERVIVTGSNIPTAEETGPNPVDTYRPEDIEKLGVRNTTDLLTNLPQEMGSTINQNANGVAGGDGSVIPNLRGLLPKETLVLIDGKRAAIIGSGGGVAAGASPGVAGVDINLIPFPMIDHIDILKDGASAIYGSDAIAGVFNIFLKHKFRGLEIGGSIGNTNLGSSNDAREVETWLIGGTGDDKTDIVIIADAYDRAAIYSRDRNITSNANQNPWGGFDNRSTDFPDFISNPEATLGFRLIPKLFFSRNSPPPHSAPNVSTSPYYTNNVPYPDGDFTLYNSAAVTASIPAADRQSSYGSFTRDICDKYLTVFADFKYTRSFFDRAGAATAFSPDPFKQPNGAPFSRSGISVPIANPFNPFTVADTTLPDGTPVTTGVGFRGINDTGGATAKTTFHDILFDAGVRGQMGEFGDYFKNWNWELGFRYSRNEEETLTSGVVSETGLRDALLDTDPATAFNPFLGFLGRNTEAAISRVYVTLHNTGEFELPLTYFHLDGDLFNLPAGPVSFAAGLEYRGERWTNNPDSENASFDAIGTFNFQASKVNRDVWGIYQEVRIPVTSPAWKLPGAYSLEFDIAEREEWYSQNTSATSVLPAEHSRFDAQKPKFSVRWQPLDPKWIGALTFRGSYSEGFHAPTLPDLTPAAAEIFLVTPSEIRDPTGKTPDGTTIRVLLPGNPFLKPEVAYEWSYGAVYNPKWIRGLTLSADFWHIDLRSLAALPDGQFILAHEKLFPQDVIRDPTTGAITTVINPTLNLTQAVVEGLDYEAIYILDSSSFGHGDLGRFTFTLNGTYLSRFELQISPDTHRFGISGTYVFLPTLTGSLPHTRAFASAFWDGPAGTWLAGVDIGATVHYTGQYQDNNILLATSAGGPGVRKVREWTTFDLIASYTFNLRAPLAQQEVAGYAKDGGKNVKMPDGKEKNVVAISTAGYGACGWRTWLNGTTITLGMQNVFDSDPPFLGGGFGNGYDPSLADVKGRFCYVQLKKTF